MGSSLSDSGKISCAGDVVFVQYVRYMWSMFTVEFSTSLRTGTRPCFWMVDTARFTSTFSVACTSA